MFTIIGGDGREYGPATVDQIRGWIAAGRANLDTKAKAAGSDEWRRLGDFPEFGTPSAPPPMAGEPPAPTFARAGVPAVAGGELAERGMRLLAWLLDQVVGFLFCLPGLMFIGFGVVVQIMQGETSAAETMTAGALMGWLVLLLGGLLLLIIQAWMLTTRGQTIGKWALGVRIVRHETGENPGFVSAVLLRFVVPGIIQALPFFGFVFFLTDTLFIFREDRRCIHDLIAGTHVVKAAR